MACEWFGGMFEKGHIVVFFVFFRSVREVPSVTCPLY